MTTPAEILAQLRADMQGAKERGMRFIDGCFGDGVTCCCALSARGPLPTSEKEEDYAELEGACNRYLISFDEASAICGGYDGLDEELYPLSPAFHAIGATLRAEFPPEG